MRNIITSSSLAALAIAASAIFAAPPAAIAQGRGGAYCLTDSDSGAIDCSYQSMSQCEQSKAGSTDICGLNSEIGGTVGFGGGAPYAEGRPPLRSPQPEPYFTR